MDSSLSDRIAVVTGASRGIGRAIAMSLARRGAHVVAVARTTGALEELDDEIKALGSGAAATLVPLDVTDHAGIDRLGGAIHERWGRLDILIGNAGVLGTLSPLSHVKPKTWDEVMAVNLTANWRLIRSLEPLLLAAPAARAVFLTSGAAHKATAYWGPYSVSKAALEVLVRTWADETRSTALRCNLLSPGPVATRMRRAAMPGEDQAGLPRPEAVAEALMPLCAADLTETGRIFAFADGRIAPREG